MSATRTGFRVSAATRRTALSYRAPVIPRSSVARASPLPFSRRLVSQPLMGRIFTEQEDEARQQVAVISYQMWHSRLHDDPRVIGQSILLDRKSYQIIGVMPRDFEFPLVPGQLNRSELWVPLSLTPSDLVQTGVLALQNDRPVEARRHASAGAAGCRTRSGANLAHLSSGDGQPARSCKCSETVREDGCGGAAYGQHAFSRRGGGAVDGLRQSCRSAAGARHPPPPRDRRSPRAGREWSRCLAAEPDGGHAAERCGGIRGTLRLPARPCALACTSCPSPCHASVPSGLTGR